jgi:hypothetical protein
VPRGPSEAPVTRDPVALLDKTMEDTRGPTKGPTCDEHKKVPPRGRRCRSSAGSSSSAGICVEGSDGVVHEQAVPEGRKKDLEKERVRRDIYERQSDVNGGFKPGPCSNFDPAPMMEQALCNHPWEHLKWGANEKCAYASCTECGLNT